VPKARKIELAAMPYSSTKNFFVPCKEEGYECAEITAEAGDNITLMTRKGKVRQMDFEILKG
jgi:plastocyanin